MRKKNYELLFVSNVHLSNEQLWAWTWAHIILYTQIQLKHKHIRLEHSKIS